MCGLSYSGSTQIERHSKNLTIIRTAFRDRSPRPFWYQIQNARLIKSLANQNDIVHTNSPTGSFLLKRLVKLKPVVTTIHGSVMDWSLSFLSTPVRYLSRYLTPHDLALYAARTATFLTDMFDYQDSSSVIFVAKHIAQSFKKHYGSPNGSMHVIYNGIRKREHQASDWEPFRFYHAGRFYLSKGLPLLIDAFRLVSEAVPSSVLNIYGAGPLSGHISRRIQQLGLSKQVFLKGFVPNDSLRRSVPRNSAFILPSTYEGCPISLVEAYMSGVPAVLPDLPWAQEFAVNGITATLASPFDVHDLSEAMLAAVKLRQSPRKIREYASRFNLSTMIDRTTEVYTSLALR